MTHRKEDAKSYRGSAQASLVLAAISWTEPIHGLACRMTLPELLCRPGGLSTEGVRTSFQRRHSSSAFDPLTAPNVCAMQSIQSNLTVRPEPWSFWILLDSI